MLVLNSQFQPFSYEQYLQPVEQATQAQQGLEDEYNQLQQQGALASAYLNKDRDANSYKTFNDYNDQLTQGVNTLLSQGLNPNSSQQLSALRQNFMKNVLPIENAIQAKKTMIQNAMQADQKDNSILRQRPIQDISIDEFVNNPDMNVGSVSGNQLTAKTAALMSQLAKSKQNISYNPIMNGQYVERAISQGYKPSQLLSDNIDSLPPEVKNLVNNIWSENNIASYSPQAKEAAAKYILDGLYAGLQQTTSSPLANKAWEINAQEASSERLAQFKANLDAQAAQQAAGLASANSPGLSYNTMQLVSPNLQGVNGKQAANTTSQILGINPLNNKFSKQVNVQVNTPGLATAQGGYNLKASLFNNNGTMLTRNQFVNQGKNSSDRAALNSYYDMVNYHIKNLGLQSPDEAAKSGKVWTVGSLSQNLIKTSNNSAPLSLEVLRMGASPEENKKYLTKLIGLQGDTNELSNIKEVTSFDRQGNIKSSPNTVKRSDFMNDKGEVQGIPQFYGSANTNTNGIIFTNNGKTYYVNNKYLGADNNETQADLANMNKMKAYLAQGLRAQGKAFLNTKLGSQIKAGLENAAHDYMTHQYLNLGWEAKTPQYNLLNNKEQ